MLSRKPRSHPLFWLASALIVLQSAPSRGDPIQMTISGTIGNSEIFGHTITPRTITLPDGLSSASSLGPIILVSADVSSNTSKFGLPADRLSPGYSYTENEPFDIRLTFHTPGSSTTSADAATIDLTGSSTRTFSVANGRETFSVSLPGALHGSITTAPGAGSSIPLSLLTQFTSVPFQLTGSMSQAKCGNKFQLALTFAAPEQINGSGPPVYPAPEPGTLLVFGAGSLAAWIARSRRIRRREPPQPPADSPR
jgi:PEP-CTERM motif